MVQSNRIIPAEMIVRMLKKIIYSGQASSDKFILTSFPDIIEQAKEFETNCCKIAAIIYSTAEDKIVEIKNNNLALFNIDSLFQKEFRLKTMSAWDWDAFQANLARRLDFGVIVGRPLSGKSTVAAHMRDRLGYHVIDMKALTEQAKAKLASGEDEDAEIQVPIGEVEKQIESFIAQNTVQGKRARFVFDGFTHAKVE